MRSEGDRLLQPRAKHINLVHSEDGLEEARRLSQPRTGKHSNLVTLAKMALNRNSKSALRQETRPEYFL